MDFIYKLILLLILNFYNITNSAWVNKRELDFINSIPELEFERFYIELELNEKELSI